MEAGCAVHLANTAALVQDTGLKYSDDDSDARWLAQLLHRGLLPEGYKDSSICCQQALATLQPGDLLL